jgi:ribosomal protein L40E
MSLEDDSNDKITFNKICPKCGVANPDYSDNCIICDKDLLETKLYIEDAFFDLEITETELVEYRKNFYRTRRTGKVKRFKLEKIEKISFGHPIKRICFIYEGKKEVYPLKDENYNLLKDFMNKTD